MPNKLMLLFLAANFLFITSGGLILAFALVSEREKRAPPTITNVAQRILLGQCPLTSAIVNSILMFITFLISLLAVLLPNNRGWLRAHGWLVVSCACFTLGLGLSIWFGTLQTRRALGETWAKETSVTQSLLQQRFNCCGYTNSTTPPFVQDETCNDSVIAAQKGGCITPFSDFANSYLDLIFTTAFGIVGELLPCTSIGGEQTSDLFGDV
ncbi:hypothetical protein H2201_003122 [Coniosporium apollinis]|uniref:Tetraspanin n=2 Tax=Coniosporium TaxID=2810619 RepID=A0ABQ9NXQ2_9PEZI|nr:hypothetical protein H2199_008463 [Cladosporium sp. JES 115]KAJ9666718.1 hypothetical protein H2201_003122 [Coniosporium apollinis]